MGIEWLVIIKSINWPQVIISLVLGGIITYFIQRYYQRRPLKTEFAVTVIKSKETDITSEFMQF